MADPASANGGLSPDSQPGLGPPSATASAAQDRDGPTAAQRKAGKRDRVALACQRCKSRKQKCDGSRPACASCARLSLKCVYIVPLVPAAAEKKLYIKALEQRVAELEGALASFGQAGASTEHLRRLSQVSSATGSTQPGATPLSTPSQHIMTPTSGQTGLSLQQQPPYQEPLSAEDEDDANEVLLAVRDLSLSASGHYVGASSNITIGRVLSSVVHSGRPSPGAHHDSAMGIHDDEDPAPKSIYSTNAGEMLGVQLLTPNVAERLIKGWFRHIHTRYPMIHSARLMYLHNNRDNMVDDCEKTTLHLIYAVSGRWLESAGEMGHFFSDQHYDLALAEMELMFRLRDSRTIDYLLLLALYCTRAPRDPGAWTYVGAAMRLCIEMGLHRRPRRQRPSVEYEMTKRRFWTTYFMDRDISIAIGRPPCISDHDIDAELPLDLKEDVTDDAVVRQAAMCISNVPVNPPNTLTSFIHRTRLKIIESEIQHNVYRVDRPDKTPDPIIDAFLDRLNVWKDTIPADARNFVHHHDVPYEGMEFYTIHYHRMVRFLLYPQLAENPVNMRYLRICADSCSGIISDYRRLHQVFPVGFSALSIQSVFLAGLTMTYCAWLAPVNHINVDGPLTDCQILLYIMTERYPSARKYRDIFERLKTTILTLISQGKHQPQNPFSFEPNVQEGFPDMQGQWESQLGADFSFMINKMTGNATTPPFDPTSLTSGPAAGILNVAPDQQQENVDMQYGTMWPGMASGMPPDMSGMGGGGAGGGNVFH